MIRACLLTGLVALAVPAGARADFIQAFDLSNVSSNNGVLSNNTIGYSFQVTAITSVGALGYYDNTAANGTGMNESHLVSIWDSSGNLKGSATVLPSDLLMGHFRYHDLSDLSTAAFDLLPGNTYTVGGYTNSGADYVALSGTTITMQDPRVQNITLLRSIGQNQPSLTGSSFAGTFGIAAPAPVPEPGTLALLGTVAAVTILARARRRRLIHP